MSHTNTLLFPLPTGRRLTEERQRLFLLETDVAAAVGRYHQTVTSIERHDRVIPPGWFEALRTLGMQLHEPTWPLDMPPYSGTEWARAIKMQPGLRHAASWWSRHLGVTDQEVRDVLRSSQAVPSSWLLKLAELGVKVPAPVKATLLMAAYPTSAEPPVTFRTLPTSPSAVLDGLRARLSAGPVVPESLGAGEVRDPNAAFPAQAAPPRDTVRPSGGSSEGALPKPPPLAQAAPAAPPQEPPSLYVHWTADGGLRFHLSAALLDRVPQGLKEVLQRMSNGSWFTPARLRTAPAKVL